MRSFASMSKLEVRPFAGEHVSDAAVLLAERHRRHRMARPLLASRYERFEAAQAELAGAMAADGASGAVALRDGAMAGFLLGAPKSDQTWGPNVWVEAAGQAVIDAEDMRELYAAAATGWVERGAKAHYVLVPATDAALIDAWFRLGFGRQHSHALRELPSRPPTVRPGLVVRRAVRADIPALVELELELPRHQGLAPVFSAGQVPSAEEARQEWDSDIDSTEYATFVAERDGVVIGSAIGCSLEKSSSHKGLSCPDNAGFLAFAAVLPDARGSGAGRALGETVMAWVAESGFDCVVTDWRTTNLLSSRAWPALGFEEAFVRLHRLIGY